MLKVIGIKKYLYLCIVKHNRKMEKYYRLVDPNFEIPNRVIDTELSEVSPRMIRSLELAPLFNILINFWRKSGVQLTTAFNSMFLFADYIKEVQYIESQGDI